MKTIKQFILWLYRATILLLLSSIAVLCAYPIACYINYLLGNETIFHIQLAIIAVFTVSLLREVVDILTMQPIFSRKRIIVFLCYSAIWSLLLFIRIQPRDFNFLKSYWIPFYFLKNYWISTIFPTTDRKGNS